MVCRKYLAGRVSQFPSLCKEKKKSHFNADKSMNGMLHYSYFNKNTEKDMDSWPVGNCTFSQLLFLCKGKKTNLILIMANICLCIHVKCLIKKIIIWFHGL